MAAINNAMSIHMYNVSNDHLLTMWSINDVTRKSVRNHVQLEIRSFVMNFNSGGYSQGLLQSHPWQSAII